VRGCEEIALPRSRDGQPLPQALPNYETLQSQEEGAWTLGLLNLGVTVLGCLVAGLLGIAVGRMWLGK
jgi:hypothetical protein